MPYLLPVYGPFSIKSTLMMSMMINPHSLDTSRPLIIYEGSQLCSYQYKMNFLELFGAFNLATHLCCLIFQPKIVLMNDFVSNLSTLKVFYV